MAHKKGGGATSQKIDSAGRRLGLKKSGNQQVVAGNIICRQRGTKWHPAENVGMGRDHTIYSLVDGIVHFFKKGSKDKTYVSVISFNDEAKSEKTKKVSVKKVKSEEKAETKKKVAKPATEKKVKKETTEKKSATKKSAKTEK